VGQREVRQGREQVGALLVHAPHIGGSEQARAQHGQAAQERTGVLGGLLRADDRPAVRARAVPDPTLADLFLPTGLGGFGVDGDHDALDDPAGVPTGQTHDQRQRPRLHRVAGLPQQPLGFFHQGQALTDPQQPTTKLLMGLGQVVDQVLGPGQPGRRGVLRDITGGRDVERDERHRPVRLRLGPAQVLDVHQSLRPGREQLSVLLLQLSEPVQSGRLPQRGVQIHG